jgi:hypothetical protein
MELIIQRIIIMSLSESDELDIDGEDIPFRDAFGISYKGLDGYELYEKLLEEKGFFMRSH